MDSSARRSWRTKSRTRVNRIPLAIVGGIAIAAVIYLLVAGATLGVLGPDAMGRGDTPIIAAAVMVIAGWGGWMILASAWMAGFSETLGDLLSTSRVGHSMGQAHELPQCSNRAGDLLVDVVGIGPLPHPGQ